MKEAPVEKRLKRLEECGFKVLKLVTPGYSGVMDRLILWPKWAPRAPTFVEVKRPGKDERPLQAAVRDDWRERGCDVRERVSTYEEVDALVRTLLREAGTMQLFKDVSSEAIS